VPSQWQLYYRAYLRLEADRPEYLAEIPWSKVAYYCEFYSLDSEQRDMLIDIVELVDVAILAHRIKKQENGNARQSRREARKNGRKARR
jgi:hypothetical protein